MSSLGNTVAGIVNLANSIYKIRIKSAKPQIAQTKEPEFYANVDSIHKSETATYRR